MQPKDGFGDLIQEDESMAAVLASFRYVRCNYKRFDRPEMFLYESLSHALRNPDCLLHVPLLTPWLPSVQPLPVQGLANQTAEKVKPSALDLMLLFKESCRLKRETAVGTRVQSLRDILWGCVAEYNKVVGTHRASRQQGAILNLKIMRKEFDSCTNKLEKISTHWNPVRHGKYHHPHNEWSITFFAARKGYGRSWKPCTMSRSLSIQVGFVLDFR